MLELKLQLIDYSKFIISNYDFLLNFREFIILDHIFLLNSFNLVFKIQEKNGDVNIGAILALMGGVLVGLIVIGMTLPDTRQIITYRGDNIGCTVIYWWSFYSWSIGFGLYYPIDKNFVMPGRYPRSAPIQFPVYFHHSWEYAGMAEVMDFDDPYIIIE